MARTIRSILSGAPDPVQSFLRGVMGSKYTSKNRNHLEEALQTLAAHPQLSNGPGSSLFHVMQLKIIIIIKDKCYPGRFYLKDKRY